MANALAMSSTEERIAARIDTDETKRLAVSDFAGGVAFADLGQVMEFGKLMAVSGVAVPKHLRGNPGACVAVCVQAIEWRMSPFAVANKSYSVSDRLAYEAQLIHAVILQRAPIRGRVKIEYRGDGDGRTCRVWAELTDEPGEIVEYVSPPFGRITPKNSPLWKSDPDQQHFYYAVRAWCRRHFPDVLLGVYARDELEDGPHLGPDRAKDVTPKTLSGKLDAIARSAPPPDPQALAGEESQLLPVEEDEGATARAGEDTPLDAVGEWAPDADAEEIEVEPDDPDYRKGWSDAQAGRSKCLKADIASDPERYRRWQAGFLAQQAGA